MKSNKVKIAVDVVITITLVLLYNTHGALGLAFHEWAGILITIGFALHVALSWGWVVSITKRLFGKTTARARFLYVLDIAVFGLMTWTILSGLFISRVAVPFLALGEPLWRATHVPISYLTLIVVGVHLGMHWEWVLSTVRRIAKAPRATPASAWALRAIAALVLVGGVYSVAATNALQQAVAFTGSDGRSEQGRPGAGFPGSGATPGQRPDQSGQSGQGRPSGQFTPGQVPPGQGRQGNDGRGRDRGVGGFDGMGGRGGSSDLTAALLHTGIVAAFAIPTYYLDKAVALNRRRRRRPVPQPESTA